jgi:very-short-patch-repair endonuclease
MRDRYGAHLHQLNSRCGHAFAAGNLAVSNSFRQEPIDRYYVDFVCRERRLIIELDGGQHSERPEDRQRDNELCALGCRVIRVWNDEVIENLDGVLQTLLSELEEPLTPSLSPQAGRGR